MATFSTDLIDNAQCTILLLPILPYSSILAFFLTSIISISSALRLSLSSVTIVASSETFLRYRGHTTHQIRAYQDYLVVPELVIKHSQIASSTW